MMVREAPIHLTMERHDMVTQPPEEIRAHNPDGAITGINCHLQIALRVERRIRWSKVGDHPLQVFRNNRVAAQTPRYTRRRGPCLQLCCRLSEPAEVLAPHGPPTPADLEAIEGRGVMATSDDD